MTTMSDLEREREKERKEMTFAGAEGWLYLGGIQEGRKLGWV